MIARIEQENEDYIANLPPSPVYSEEPSPGEIGMPEGHAVDPFKLNENRPDEPPPDYTPVSPEIKNMIYVPQFSRTGNNSLNGPPTSPRLPSRNNNRNPTLPLRRRMAPPLSPDSYSQQSPPTPRRRPVPPLRPQNGPSGHQGYTPEGNIGYNSNNPGVYNGGYNNGYNGGYNNGYNGGNGGRRF
ncbi:unnamed protein product [[Candida] boidinii]|uniref:Unnamed protein product n=1 Tax=Candida boidinii TaxID=5477 RepID=A0A9W6T5T3_CANBO|nr:unnamed protein product [[Candida] boidinii]GMF51440.1 unnamed protein product [[Candida] boidinii]